MHRAWGPRPLAERRYGGGDNSGGKGGIAAAGLPPDDTLLEQAFLGEMPVVLSASRMLQPVSEAPEVVTVIDREMTTASGFRDVANLFRLVCGFYAGYYNGHEPVVAHGVAWTDLPLALQDIERIEVVRGPTRPTTEPTPFSA